MTLSIVDFLNARLTEDENAARLAFAEHNQAEAEWTEIRSGAIQLGPNEDELITFDLGVSRHIVRHDPARVLREVTAKRALLTEHTPNRDICDAHDPITLETEPCNVILALAAIYSDHESYLDEWRP